MGQKQAAVTQTPPPKSPRKEAAASKPVARISKLSKVAAALSANSPIPSRIKKVARPSPKKAREAYVHRDAPASPKNSNRNDTVKPIKKRGVLVPQAGRVFTKRIPKRKPVPRLPPPT